MPQIAVEALKAGWWRRRLALCVNTIFIDVGLNKEKSCAVKNLKTRVHLIDGAIRGHVARR